MSNFCVITFSGRLSRFADEIAREEKAQVFAIRIDCSDSRSVREAFEGVLSLGFVEVLIYNANQQVSRQPTRFIDVRIDSFEKSLAVSSVGAFHCSQQVHTHTQISLSSPPFPFPSFPQKNQTKMGSRTLCKNEFQFVLGNCRLFRGWWKEEEVQFSLQAAQLL